MTSEVIAKPTRRDQTALSAASTTRGPNVTVRPLTAPTAPLAAPAAANRPSPIALLVMLSGTFMAVLDFFIVNVAIPSIQHELHASSGALQLIVIGYGLANAAALITGGRLGDIHGRRRLFMIGIGLFTLASAACGLAPNAEW